jgi:enoyl-CoA hydratase/carnithine racemase
MEWVLPGSHVSAQEPLAHGLVSSVHPAAELMLAAMKVAIVLGC